MNWTEFVPNLWPISAIYTALDQLSLRKGSNYF